MKDNIGRYHLKTGLLVAILFPGIFIFSDSEAQGLFSRFFSSFSCIFILWFFNFWLVDFRVNKNLKARHYISRLAGKLVLSLVFAVALYIFIGFTIGQTSNLLSQVSGDRQHSAKAWLFLILRIIFFDALIILVKFIYDSYEEKRQIEFENEFLKRENLHARHEALKQQVNPHFLFNSLNTLKSLVKRNADHAVDFTSELSSIYRYMLLHQDKSEVALRDEIEFSKSYVYLLKIRFGDAINTRIEVNEELLDSLMPPNTLQLLIENAVKHNILSIKKPLFISILTKETFLIVENNFQPKAVKEASSHLGLDNIRSRYLLLDGKEISIQRNEECFQVVLPIIKRK
ncbi:MAG TPA: histidine kinase [Chitinophagaceae bacterium]|nr:histidine kinase [Chitinophagaceae bacterium]